VTAEFAAERMMRMVRRMTGPWWTAAVALVVAGCGGVSGNAAGVGAGAVATVRSSASASASASVGAGGGAVVAKTATPAVAIRPPAKAIWLRSLQMTSATTGWALYYSANPNSSSAALLLARTTDGGRSWTDVTPVAARPMLAAPDATQVLDPVSGDRAYLAVTGATQESNTAVNTTMVFVTTDGGRTWADSAPLRAVSTVSEVSFADPEQGFLMLGGGDDAMGEDAVWLYRTADGGAHWSLAAATPAPTGTAVSSQPGPGRIPAACDKSGLAFPTATNGWIAGTCNAGLANALLVSQDGGVSWADEPLPLPASICAGGACTVSGPQFLDGTGFVTVDPEPAGAALLVTRDLGQTWDQVALPTGLQYPQITFFSPTQGVLVARETQGAFGGTFYTTADGGQTWTPVPQGANLTRLGVTVDFATPEDGFAWTNGLETDSVPPTSIYETTNSGRTWHAFTPKLAA
jgi:photosystem II stability/assembly factor-like uncharacterized protein